MSYRHRVIVCGLWVALCVISACSREDTERLERAGAKALDATLVAVTCRVDRVKCNDDCGDGLIGQACQDICTFSYHECMD